MTTNETLKLGDSGVAGLQLRHTERRLCSPGIVDPFATSGAGLRLSITVPYRVNGNNHECQLCPNHAQRDRGIAPAL